MKRIHRVSAVALATISMAACAAPGPDQWKVQQGTPVSENVTPNDAAFACARQKLATLGRPITVAVSDVKDYTGKFTNEAAGGGYAVTQGGALMVTSALGKLAPQVEVVERFDPKIGLMELNLSKEKLVRDSDNAKVVRAYTAGPIVGSDFFITGGVTEANYNIQSGGVSLGVSMVGGSARYFVMNLAADLRIVNTRSLTVPTGGMANFQKQFVGEEIRANIFRFLSNQLIDFDGGVKNQEPLQLGVRSILEAETIKIVGAAAHVDVTPCVDMVVAQFDANKPQSKVAEATPAQAASDAPAESQASTAVETAPLPEATKE